MRATTAHSVLLPLASLVALAAAGCNGYMLYHVQRAFASAPSPEHTLFRWRALLIAAEAVCGATALYALAHSLVRRRNAYSALVATHTDVLCLAVLGGGAAAIGVLLFLSYSPARDRLYSLAHCAGLARRCTVHFAGGAALLLAALLLLLSALFEAIYASQHPGGWGESLHALSSDLGSDGPKYKKRKSHMSISEPFQVKEGSIDVAPLMHAPAPCATLPSPSSAFRTLDDYPRNTPAPPSPARPESALGPTFPKSPSTGSVSTLATTPLFGLAPAYITPGQRTSSLSPTPSQSATFGRSTISATSGGSNPSLHANPYRTPSQRSTNPYTSSPSTTFSSENARSPSQRTNPYSDAYAAPHEDARALSESSHASHKSARSYPSSPRRENPYKTGLRPPAMPGVEERPKLSMEQLDRKRTLFAEGML
ncbi:hypothetical protein CC85DRAFT_330748 [Cutaneotrichosporon oleaginosum]|uniref:Uncharacterized protein n=1 Tax=Cutaneotrichosporon oleaginosum TaxID=879819 RepID=A0A0J0XEF4_9TREE|nr:uncharacterized protein CC85DRAFT_330748 [Cutaneotrichosporon oleaginosum]KLT39437.1 hypothetical protein CC85DRAFT_330748 [Cutaneotrichosporon oleaginosum]TXT08443.1 hypothetical protein COLE_05367 [Cutaneotrichosporon oleaginosum]